MSSKYSLKQKFGLAFGVALCLGGAALAVPGAALADGTTAGADDGASSSITQLQTDFNTVAQVIGVVEPIAVGAVAFAGGAMLIKRIIWA